MNDYQFEFEGQRFGLHLPVAVDGEGFDPGEDALEATDGAAPVTNSRSFGRDAWTPGDWTWEIHTDDAGDAATALEDMAQLERIWKAAARSKKVADVRPLKYQVAGRERVIFGRPGQWTGNVDGLHYGKIDAQIVFRRADLLHYGDARSVVVESEASPNAGLVAPIVAPIVTLAGGSRGGVLSSQAVGGDAPAPFVATITAGNAPLTNPALRGDGWKIALTMTLAPGRSVRISTYPWEADVTRDTGGYLNGYLTPDSRLSKARLDPTGEALFFDAIDSSGTSTCSVQWRPAYSTI